MIPSCCNAPTAARPSNSTSTAAAAYSRNTWRIARSAAAPGRSRPGLTTTAPGRQYSAPPMNSGMLKTALVYGIALAAGAVLLQWLEYQIWARSHPGTIYVALIAAGFLGLGIWVGRRLFRSEPRGGTFVPNER